MARVRGVLGRMPESEKVVFVSEEESFIVYYYGDKLLGKMFSDKVMSVVIVPGVRKALEDVGKAFTKE